MIKKLKVGLIGCGKQAPKHISGLRASQSADIEIVVADINTDMANSLGDQFDLEVADSVDSIFQMKDIDAIDICTPVPTHHDLCVRALEAGKHIFCEKPLVTSLTEAQELEKLRNEKGLVGMVGYLYRFAPTLNIYKNLTDQKGFKDAFGAPVLANLRIGGRGSHQLWKHQKDKGGGAVNEMLVHMVDLALWFFGKPLDISVFSCEQLLSERTIGGVLHSVDAEDSVVVQLKMESGVTVNIQADMLTPSFTQFVEIQGQNGTFCGSIQPSYHSYLFLNQTLGDFEKGMNTIDIGASNLFEAQMGEFVNAVLDPNTHVSSSIEDSINLLKVMDQINKCRYEH